MREEKSHTEDNHHSGYLSFGIGVLVVIILMVMNANISTNHTGGSSIFDNSAITNAQYLVKEKLKSPSTAKFCGKSDTSVTEVAGVYTVRGCVDAENSFGGKVRSSWSVKMEKSGGRWIAIDVSVY